MTEVLLMVALGLWLIGVAIVVNVLLRRFNDEGTTFPPNRE